MALQADVDAVEAHPAARKMIRVVMMLYEYFEYEATPSDVFQ